MGGIGAYTVGAAAALAAAGVEAHVFTFGLPGDVRGRLGEIAPGVKVHEVADAAARVAAGTLPGALAGAITAGGEAGYRLALGWLLAEAALEGPEGGGFDVIEAPEYEGLGVATVLRLAGMRGARGGRRPGLVTHLHSGSAINRRGNGVRAAAGDLAIDALELAAIELADGLCAPSEAVVRETRVGLPFERAVTVIPQAVAVGEEFVPPPGEGPIVFVGRLERLKGAEVLLEAARVFLPRCAGARLLVIGPDTPTAPGGAGGTGRTSMQQWMRGRLEAGISERVTFAGELPPSEVAGQVAGARFVVVPSLFESFSLVAAGAMAAGRTVVVSDGTGAAEVVGEAGLTFERGSAAGLAAAMERLWLDGALLGDLSRRAQERARATFDPAVVVPRRVAFYRGVMEAAASGAAEGIDARLAKMAAPFGGAMARMRAALRGEAEWGGEQGMVTPGKRLLGIMEEVARGGGARVLLYGAGRHSARLLAERGVWESRGHRVVGFIDDAPRWAAGGEAARFLDLPVETGAAALARARAGEAVGPIVLSTDTFEDQFWEKTAELRAAGVRVVRLYGKSG